MKTTRTKAFLFLSLILVGSVLQAQESVEKPQDFSLIEASNISNSEEALPSEQIVVDEYESKNFAHARELMGKYFYGSRLLQVDLDDKKIKDFVHKTVKEELPAKFKKYAKRLSRTILEESKRYNFDPVFLMAVMRTESTFRPDAVGGIGEIGLMQIRPETGKWLCQKFGFTWKGKKTLKDPIMNVRLGSAFLDHLRKNFDSHGQLYISAYNIGARKVSRKVSQKDPWPKDYASRVMKHYMEFYDLMASEQQEIRTQASTASL